MLDTLNQWWAQLATTSPWLYAAIVAALAVLRSKGIITLPILDKKKVEEPASGPGTDETQVDPDEPLRERLRRRIVDRFDQLVADAEDADDAYKRLLDAIRKD